MTLLIVTVVVVALAFGFTNGFHDASNALATSITTRALTPHVAVVMGAAMNFVGALLGTGVAEVIGSGILSPPDGAAGLLVVLAGLLGAILWNLATWWFGLPSSSSHAVVGGLAGAGVVSATQVHWDVLGSQFLLPLVLSPLVGFGLAYLLMRGVMVAFRNQPYAPTMRRFRAAQTISAAGMALGHGLQDAQKTMGVVVLALVAGGLHSGTAIPLWVKLAAAAVMAAGTLAGGWRIIRTLGRRIIQLDPARGFVAETVAASVVYATAAGFQVPISTTHTTVAAIAGVGVSDRLSGVRWGVAGHIALAWLLTIPVSGLLAAGIYAAASPLL